MQQANRQIGLMLTTAEVRAAIYACEFARDVFSDAALAHSKLIVALERAGA